MQMKQNMDLSYVTMAQLAKDIRQFIGINQLILENGFSAPHIFVEDFEKGLLILEDFGNEGILDKSGHPLEERYIACSELLATFHQKSWPSQKQFATFLLQIPSYDCQVLQTELSLLLDWYIPFQIQKNLDQQQRKAFLLVGSPILIILLKERTHL